MRLKHILLRTPLLVDDLMLSLRQGADFSVLAREHSACPSARNGGDIGLIKPEDLPQSIKDALAEAPIGEVSGPIQTRHGYHLIELESL